MNYYEHHIGDYAEATGHLSFIEDAAYSRLIRKYYSSEKPLPADIKAVQRLVSAKSKKEKVAVETILNEFFTLEHDGWHNERCDEDIQKFHDGEPDRKIKKANEENRLKKHREERSRLFQALHTVGQFPSWNVSIAQLRALHEQFCNAPETQHKTFRKPLPATAPATPATATQSPVPSPQSPDTNLQVLSEKDTHARVVAIKSIYPKGTGRVDWIMGEKYLRIRAEEGESWDDMQAVVERYARYCQVTGSLGTQFVLSPQKFFSADDKPWRQAWDLPATKADTRLAGNLDAAAEAKRQLFGNSQ